ncbi:MAG TPA: alpha/beta fold hydrolase [Actinomycetota bacterium]|nr:alpha/beta fold hydrolase [Actinomycetota bacterium]
MSGGRWLVVPKPSPQARLALYCFPNAGAGAAPYRPWADVLAPDIEVRAVTLPGREWRLKEPPVSSLPPLIDSLFHEISPELTPPFVFFGHSLGAMLGFELARRLRSEGLPLPATLIVSAHHAPTVPSDHPRIHDAPDDVFIQGLRGLSGTSDDVLDNRELMDLMMPALRADFAVAETYEYRPQPPLPCDIAAYGGLEDKLISRERLAPWKEQTSGKFTLRMFPGSHFFIHECRELVLRAVYQDTAAN